MSNRAKDRQFISIRGAVDAGCQSAQKAGIKGPVNWADLGCVEVEYYETESGDSGYRAYVSEASPSASDLRNFLAGFVAEQVNEAVQIITEW